MAVRNEVIRTHKLYKNIKANLEEACRYIHDLESDCQDLSKEYQYLSDFIHYKGLTEEFRYFRKHAHPDGDKDLPVPRYVL